MSGEDDSDLRELFSRLRQEEAEGAPAFAELRQALPARRRAPLRVGLLAAVALAGVVLAVRLGLERPEPAPIPTDMLSVTTWKAPTDFLLATPGREVLSTVPRFGGDLPTLPLETGVEKHSERRTES